MTVTASFHHTTFEDAPVYVLRMLHCETLCLSCVLPLCVFNFVVGSPCKFVSALFHSGCIGE